MGHRRDRRTTSAFRLQASGTAAPEELFNLLDENDARAAVTSREKICTNGYLTIVLLAVLALFTIFALPDVTMHETKLSRKFNYS
jgi:hypothetical protein